MSEISLAEAARIIATDMPPCVRDLGIEVVGLDAGRATVHMAAGPNSRRIGNIVSGQALASLADTSMVFAMWSALGAVGPVSTVDLHVTYMRAAGEGEVIAEAEVVRKGRTFGFARVSMSSASSPWPACRNGSRHLRHLCMNVA